MKRKVEGIEIVRDLDRVRLSPLNDAEASVVDGMVLNRGYVDVRGCDASELAYAIEEEELFFEEAAGLEKGSESLFDLLDHYFMESDLQFDVGVNAAVVAISVVGGTPISSCNGGWFGDDHSSAVPHILFSVSAAQFAPIQAAAEAAHCGLINNGRHAELYADELPKLLAFAREIASGL